MCATVGCNGFTVDSKHTKIQAMTATLVIEMPKRVIDISQYWPTDKNGDPFTVNKVWNDNEVLNPEKIGRYTLQKAREGVLGGGEIDTLYDLVAACSRWSGKPLDLKDLIKEVEDY